MCSSDSVREQLRTLVAGGVFDVSAEGAMMSLAPETGIAREHRAEQLAIWEGRYPA